MTSPQLPAQPISSPYALLANGANGATSGLAEFASWTKDDWDAFLSGKWVPHFDGIGGPLAAAWEWINAITSAFQGDFGPLEDLLGEVIEGFVAGFTDLKAAFEGTYTGTDSVLLGIQSFVSGKWLGLGNAQTMLQQIADILNGLIVTPINTAVQGVKDWFAGLLGWRTDTDTAVIGTKTAIADCQDRITALENGGTMFLLTSSQTLNLSAYANFKVYLFGAGKNGAVASGYDSGAGGAGGNFRFRVFSKAQLVGYGVDISAVQVVVGAGNSVAGNPTRFGNYGSSWALDTGTAANDSYAIDSDGLFRDITAKTPPGNGGGGGAGGRKADQGSFAGASPGGTTHLATGGAAGQAYGEAGQPGANADLSSGREFAGGAGGGGGNGGEMGTVVSNTYFSAGKNGGNGGNGGFPGAGGGGTGGGGRGTSTGTPGQIPGAGAPGVAIVVAS